jgi:hypothetical protein
LLRFEVARSFDRRLSRRHQRLFAPELTTLKATHIKQAAPVLSGMAAALNAALIKRSAAIQASDSDQSSDSDDWSDND